MSASFAWGMAGRDLMKHAVRAACATAVRGERSTAPAWSSAARRLHGASGAKRPFSTHVSVIGLHWTTDETRLREVFGRFGTLEEAKLLSPAHSDTHLWASLVYSTFEEALQAAVDMNGQALDGRLLRVSIVDAPGQGDNPAPERPTDRSPVKQ